MGFALASRRVFTLYKFPQREDFWVAPTVLLDRFANQALHDCSTVDITTMVDSNRGGGFIGHNLHINCLVSCSESSQSQSTIYHPIPHWKNVMVSHMCFLIVEKA